MLSEDGIFKKVNCKILDYEESRIVRRIIATADRETLRGGIGWGWRVLRVKRPNFGKHRRMLKWYTRFERRFWIRLRGIRRAIVRVTKLSCDRLKKPLKSDTGTERKLETLCWIAS